MNWRTALVYVLSGLASAAAAIFYVAHFGQATADAGMEYELKAITAVVLGGIGLSGGRGGVINVIFMNHFQEMARGHFIGGAKRAVGGD